jgi:hypothetical protein
VTVAIADLHRRLQSNDTTKAAQNVREMLDYIAPLQGGDWGKAYEVE